MQRLHQVSRYARQTNAPHVRTPGRVRVFPVLSRGLCRILGQTVFALLACAVLVVSPPAPASGSLYDFVTAKPGETLFAVDPDLIIRSMNPLAHDRIWALGKGWGVPPLYFHSQVPGIYDRVDFFYPLGAREESTFQSKVRFTPFFKSHWSKLPPFDGYSRCLTLYQGRSDLGQDYWGFFPFYGYTYRRFGVDRNFFLLFPLYYESSDDDARTIRLLWPFITYANSPGRSSVQLWPLAGTDRIRNEYRSSYFLWPLFQSTDKHMGTEQASSYRALLFPVLSWQEDCYSASASFLWPLISYYHHYRSGHRKYTFLPFFSYGTGGGIEEVNILYLYKYRRDYRKGTSSVDGYVSVADDEVATERKFLFLSSIKKRFRKGLLVYAKYKLWPFAEYSWDLDRGSHFAFPEIIPLKNDWWDLNLGHLLRIVDFRDTPITRELSVLFGLSRRTELKAVPHISRPPTSGEDNWTELVTGAFGKR